MRWIIEISPGNGCCIAGANQVRDEMIDQLQRGAKALRDEAKVTKRRGALYEAHAFEHTADFLKKVEISTKHSG